MAAGVIDQFGLLLIISSWLVGCWLGVERQKGYYRRAEKKQIGGWERVCLVAAAA